MTTDIDTSAQQREALANRLVGDLCASFETLGVWLGLRLRLYAALDRLGGGTATDLASAAGIDTRLPLRGGAPPGSTPPRAGRQGHLRRLPGPPAMRHLRTGQP